ncbi:MAG TPA: HAMP domain-containing sensor histidine kinase [Cyclobacteriaceae bacterium]|nr:HAMP domain-containing sensor histidine kinase [Cyclobacteriaceae bacterium]
MFIFPNPMEAIAKVRPNMEARAKTLYERIMILAMILAFVHFAEDFIYDTREIWVTDLLVLVSAVFSYLLHRRGYELPARIISFILITGMITYFAVGTHARNGIQWHYLSIIVISLVIFSNRYRYVGILFVSFVYLILIVLEVNQYELDWFPTIGETERSTLSVIINITSAVLVLVYAIVTLMLGSEAYEEQISRQVEDVKKLNKELDSFVYSASHDLKAPLASLRGLLSLAQQEKDASMVKLYFSKMEATITQSESFIKNITDYSKNVRTDLNPVAIELQPLIEDLFSNLSFVNGHEDIKLHLQLECKTIVADGNRMQAVLGNLLSNALKYSDPGKPERWIKVTSREDGEKYYLTVEDNGIGVSPEHLPHLFEMFYRASEQSSGSGLGLYIVSESLQRMGASIKAESEPGQGTKFQVQIPK